ncbi:MAG: amidohydrolase [Armatimonadota bacterium]|nr:MAG: amidohydrolase [Armatimonadota bacterium]
MATLLERVRAGDALDDSPVIDAHAHMGQWFAFHVPDGTAAGMIRTMDRMGVKACVASGHAGIGPDFVLGNDEVARGAESFPGRIFGYIVVNPNYSAEEMRAELERCWATGHFVGIKFHASMHSYRTDGERYAPAWEFANERGLPVLSHDGAANFEEPARNYPNAKLLIAHAISSQDMLDAATALALRRPNVYLDICGSPLIYGALEQAVDKVGAERILFGTDLPFIDPRPQVGRVAFAKISEADKLRILGENALALLRLEGRLG